MSSWYHNLTKENKRKAAVILAAVLTFCFLVGVIWWQRKKMDEQRAQLGENVVQMKRLKGDIVRAESRYVSKADLEHFAKKNNIDLKPIKKDIDELDADLKGISSALARTPGLTARELSSTRTEPRPDKPNVPATVECKSGEKLKCPDQDAHGYLSSAQELDLDEPLSDNKKVPYGKVKFSAWREKPWDLNVYPREYRAITVLSQDEDGRHYVHNKLTVTSDGKTEAIPIDQSEFLEEYPRNKFRFDPSLYLGIDGGFYIKEVTGELTPNLQLFWFSYGQTKTNPTWIFLGTGVGYETQQNSIGFLLSPVSYNIGELLPLINNLYIGPSVSIDPAGRIGILGGLRVGL